MPRFARVLCWFRRDLRLSDQAALIAAAGEGPVIPVYVLDDETPKHRKMGGASRWWLHHSLKALQAEFAGVPLVEGDLFGGVASGLAYSRG